MPKKKQKVKLKVRQGNLGSILRLIAKQTKQKVILYKPDAEAAFFVANRVSFMRMAIGVKKLPLNQQKTAFRNVRIGFCLTENPVWCAEIAICLVEGDTRNKETAIWYAEARHWLTENAIWVRENAIWFCAETVSLCADTIWME